MKNIPSMLSVLRLEQVWNATIYLVTTLRSGWRLVIALRSQLPQVLRYRMSGLIVSRQAWHHLLVNAQRMFLSSRTRPSLMQLSNSLLQTIRYAFVMIWRLIFFLIDVLIVIECCWESWVAQDLYDAPSGAQGFRYSPPSNNPTTHRRDLGGTPERVRRWAEGAIIYFIDAWKY